MYLNDRLETKLTENWDGDYNPKIGRFLTEDPIGFSSGYMNLFSYVANHPVNFSDPLGLSREDIVSAINFVRQIYPDALKSTGFFTANIGEVEGAAGLTNTFPFGISPNIYLDNKYLEPLNEKELWDLLDTVFHEALHAQNGWMNEITLTDSEHKEIEQFANGLTNALFQDFLQYNQERKKSCIQ